MSRTTISKAQQTIDLHDQYLTHNYPRYDRVMVDGKRCTLSDAEGRSYLDMFAGFGAGILGHCHPDLVAAGTKQMNKLWHVGNLLHTEPQTLLAQAIIERSFPGQCFFCHSGNDANEAAFKLARLYGQGERYKIIATENSFHGRGFAGIMATGQAKVRQGFAPLLEGFSHVPYNNLKAMEQAIDAQTVAIIVEPIQGEGGIHVPDAKYLAGLRKLCDQHDLLLIFDEVWTGCGRTGTWFGHQQFNVLPDMMTLGKAIGCGLPVGVLVANEKTQQQFDHAHYGGVPHATTLGGNAVAMAVALRMFEVIEQDELLHHTQQRSAQLFETLNPWVGKVPGVKQIRGMGLFIGIELDPTDNNANYDSAGDIARAALDAGLIVNGSGNVVRLAPPLIITEEELDQGLSMLQQCLQA